MRTRVLSLLLLGLTPLFGPSPAVATDFCAQNDSQFKTALTLVEITPGSHRLLLGAGKTFHIAGTRLDSAGTDGFEPYGALTIEGGYNADCSAHATYDAASSVLDGTGAGVGLNWLAIAGNDLTISTLTLTHLSKRWDVSSGGNHARLRWLHVRTVDNACVRIEVFAGDDRIARIENSLFARISGGGDLCVSALDVSDRPDGGQALQLSLTNNTVSTNTRGGVSLYSPDGIARLYNNILYGNDSGFVDLDNTDAPTIAIDNIVGTHAGTYFAGSTGNSTADPLFVSATNFNLQTASPARESGTSGAPYGLSAFDIEGGDRVVGSVVDRGAYEADSSGATILLVTNTNDVGAGSLRAAITDANANPAFNVIGFNIPGACPRTIAVNTELPAITDGIAIRGYTQPGSSMNGSSLIDNAKVCVELVETVGQNVQNGLRFAPATDDDSLDVSGLAIGGFNRGVYVDHTNTGTGVAFSIWGNFIGLAADGSTLRANTFAGVDITGRSYGTIGGDDDAQRNVIAGALAGVRTVADQTTWTVNNFIGTTAGGGAARPNAIGVALLSPGQYVRDNVISGNSAAGVSVAADANYIEGNRIGVKSFAICVPPCTPDYALGNGGDGVVLSGARSVNRIQDNTIAWNDGAGVRIAAAGALRNSISSNRIYDNVGLGIDLGSVGVDPIDNDATATANAPNHGLNAPEPAFSRGGTTTGHVFGQLHTVNGTYIIEAFSSPSCDASGHGQGSERVGSGTVTITDATASANGATTFDIPIADSTGLVGRAITATAIYDQSDTTRQGDTSEFSSCVTHEFVDLIFANGFDPAAP